MPLRYATEDWSRIMGFATEAMVEEARQCISSGKFEADRKEKLDKSAFLTPWNIATIVERVRSAYCRVYLDEVGRAHLRPEQSREDSRFTVTVRHDSITRFVSANGKCQDALLAALVNAEPSTYGLSFNCEVGFVNVMFRPPAIPTPK